MNTKEIYLELFNKSDMPIGRIGYVYKDKNNIIQIGSTMVAEFISDEKTIEKYVNKMKEIEKIDGFMFWNNSEEGKKFFDENWNEIGKCLSSMVLNQK
jgi:hypothetical protein